MNSLNFVSNFSKQEIYLISFILAINTLTLLLYGFDKLKAKKNSFRIPEFQLLLFGVLGGGIGSLMGMVIFKHKLSKYKFTIGVPIIIGINFILYLFMANWLRT